MKTPTLNFRENLTYPTLLYNIEMKETELLSQLERLIFDFNVANKYCLNLCYTSLFIFPLTAGCNYTFSDICSNVKGLFTQSLYDILVALSNIGMQSNIKDSLYKILHDCTSYEVFSLLRVNPVKVYGLLLYYYVLLSDLPRLKVSSGLILEAINSNTPTLDWERLYLYFEEEVNKHDHFNC